MLRLTFVGMIEATNLTKAYGRRRAVDDLTFTVHPGRITGFLGPNGAGKSTMMRLALGLAEPTSGRITVNGRPYRRIVQPLREVGALLEARCTHPGRTARHHLQYLAQSNAIPARRVDEVLELVGLPGVADRRTGGFSLGMAQRLGIAAALLGDPVGAAAGRAGQRPGHRRHPVDPRPAARPRRRGKDRPAVEPPHGGDGADRRPPCRDRVGSAARRGGHAGVHRPALPTRTWVRTPQLERLRPVLTALGARVTTEAGAAVVEGVAAADIGQAAARIGAVLHELSPRLDSLEDVYTRLTATSVEYRAAGLAA